MPLAATRADESDDVRAVTAAIAGDLASWDVLYRVHADGLRAYIRALDGADDPDDVLQTVWLQIVRDIGQLRDPAMFPAWIRSIARHTTYRSTRTHRRRHAATSPMWGVEAADPTADPEAQLVNAEDADRARRALAGLPPRARDLLTARVIEEMAPADIAASVGRSTDSVNVSLTRARKALRVAYDRLPLLLPPGVWRVIRRVQEFGPAATETVVAVAVAGLLMLAVSPAPINRGDDIGPAADAPPSSAATATTAPAEADTRAVERTAVPAAAPGPDHVGPVGVADRAEEDPPYEEVIVVPEAGGRGVRFYDGDYSEHPRPDVYLEDSTGRQVRLWVFDEATGARPEDAPYIEVVTSDMTPAAP